MDDDWDLHAVVRGCATTGTTSASADNLFLTSYSLPLHNDRNTYDFSDLLDDRSDPFQGLHEIYTKFCVDEQFSPPAAVAIPGGTAASSPAAYPPQDIPVMLPSQMNMRAQENLQLIDINLVCASSSSLNMPEPNLQQTRNRRRKNQQTKVVREMTQEELSADSWAWRKYGQKPIKGSPYPRNYYRCSTSKGCAARKQVERSPNDSNIFIVSYTGEHTHPRPTHRSSLAGSIRNKAAAAATISNITPLVSPSWLSVSDFSPNTPLPAGEAVAQTGSVAVVRGEEDGGGDEDLENIFLTVLQDSDDHNLSGGDGDDLILSPP